MNKNHFPTSVLAAALTVLTALSACSGESKSDADATATDAAAVDSTMTTQPLDNTATATAGDTAVADSVRHAHLHKSNGMVHNHEHGHPAADTAHRGQ